MGTPGHTRLGAHNTNPSTRRDHRRADNTCPDRDHHTANTQHLALDTTPLLHTCRSALEVGAQNARTECSTDRSYVEHRTAHRAFSKHRIAERLDAPECPIRRAYANAERIPLCCQLLRVSLACVAWSGPCRGRRPSSTLVAGPGVAYPKSRPSGCEAGHAGLSGRPRLPSRTRVRGGVGDESR